MRVFLASTGSGMSKAVRRETVNKCKPLYILETFFNGEKACAEALDIVGNENFLLDSGAYSYMNGQSITLADMERYVERYIEFIKRRRIQYYFEIDVDNIFGLPQVETWRNKIETATGRRCIPVWHKGRGVEYFKKMCSEYSYIAVGGLVFHVKKQEYELIKRLVHYAYLRGIKVHGLGFTKTRELGDYDFYSVDSSSWTISAARGQQIHFFKDGRIETRGLKKGDRKVKLGELVAHNMQEWVKYQKYMDGVR